MGSHLIFKKEKIHISHLWYCVTTWSQTKCSSMQPLHNLYKQSLTVLYHYNSWSLSFILLNILKLGVCLENSHSGELFGFTVFILILLKMSHPVLFWAAVFKFTVTSVFVKSFTPVMSQSLNNNPVTTHTFIDLEVIAFKKSNNNGVLWHPPYLRI